jgi:hypothetical protein
MINKPTFDQEGTKNRLQRFLNKKNSVLYALEYMNNYEDDPIHAVEAFSMFLAEYSEELINTQEDPVSILHRVGKSHGLTEETLYEIENCITNTDYSPYKKSGNKKIKVSYNEFLKSANLVDDEFSRTYYNDPEEFGYDYNAYERYNFSRSEDMELLSKHLLGIAYKGISYDKESVAYKLTGALYYFSRRNAEELRGMTTAYYNLKDIGSAVGFEMKDAIYIMDLLSDVATSDVSFDDPNSQNSLKKAFKDFFLNKIFMESDNYGNIKLPTQEELDNMNSDEAEINKGATVQDGFKMAKQRANYLENRR